MFWINSSLVSINIFNFIDVLIIFFIFFICWLRWNVDNVIKFLKDYFSSWKRFLRDYWINFNTDSLETYGCYKCIVVVKFDIVR